MILSPLRKSVLMGIGTAALVEVFKMTSIYQYKNNPDILLLLVLVGLFYFMLLCFFAFVLFCLSHKK